MASNLKTLIITGASNGLGYETVRKIAQKRKDFRIIMACRNLAKANKVKEQIFNETQNPNLIVMEIDTSSLESVKNFVENYKKTNYGEIYSLVCNAGIGGSCSGNSVDGYDIIFATNHLGHFLLVNLLIPFMAEKGKITIISSDMHDPPKEWAPNYHWVGAEKCAKPDENLAKSPMRYSLSKLCNLYFTYELVKRIKDKKLYINAFTPGFLPETGLSGEKKFPPEMIKRVAENHPQRMGIMENSASALCDIATLEEIKNNGEFFDRSTKTIKTSELSYNEDNAKELWALSENYVKKYY